MINNRFGLINEKNIKIIRNIKPILILIFLLKKLLKCKSESNIFPNKNKNEKPENVSKLENKNKYLIL